LQCRALPYKTRFPIPLCNFILFELRKVFFSNKVPGKGNLRAWSPCNPIKALKKENRLRKPLISLNTIWPEGKSEIFANKIKNNFQDLYFLKIVIYFIKADSL
jgi:hypothetical protein